MFKFVWSNIAALPAQLADCIMRIRAALIRGGTSKGLFLRERLPDAMISRLLGSPDPTGMQLDGLGGGISSTSKVAVVTRSERPRCHVDYLFGQVDMKSGRIDWEGACGNLASAAAMFALEEKLLPRNSTEPTAVRIWQANAEYEMEVVVPSPTDSGSVRIPGVPGTAPPLRVDFLNPRFGSSELLPTGNPVDTLELPCGEQIDATLACGANPTIFVQADALGVGMPGVGYPERLSEAVEALRLQGAAAMGIPLTAATRVSWVAPAMRYTASDGSAVQDADLLASITTPGRVHHAYTGTGAVNLACMACIEGTVVERCSPGTPKGCEVTTLIGHPGGVMEVRAKCEMQHGVYRVVRAGFTRTARMLMHGDVCVPNIKA